MEGRTHSRRDYSPLGRMSRTERDLISWSRELESKTDNGSAAMIRRMLPRSKTGRAAHVCVVGAGMAGLRCAEVLIEKGIKITILEGRHRIGGRIHQSNQLGHMLDMGPNWIHGTDHNPILDLAEETNTVAFSTEERSSVFDELGQLMDEKKATAFSEIVWGIISDAFRYSNDKSSSIPPNRSLKDFVTEEVEKKDLSPADRTVVLQMAEMWGAFVGDPIGRQSLKYFWLEECIDGENLFVASTYKAILDRVAKIILAKADVRLSTKVTSVKSKSSPGEDPNIIITTQDGSSLEFDEAVLTPPLGWLKRNLSAFSPPLPRPITRAIANISYGRLEKVFVTFPTAFWDDPSPTAVPAPVPSPGSPNPPSTPESTKYPFFTHFLHPTYHPQQNPHAWNIELVSLSALPPPTAHPTLLFYIHGPCASHITTLVSGLQPPDPEYFARLDAFFEPYYSRLPNFATHDPACRPLGILATDWQNDELAGWGSYTNFQVSELVRDGEGGGEGEGGEEVQLDRDIEALREGLPDRGIWFAGEHTAPFVALGTVTGAWWSGEGVGRRIAAVYGLERKEEVVAATVGGGDGDDGVVDLSGVRANGKLDGEKAKDGASLNGIAL